MDVNQVVGHRVRHTTKFGDGTITKIKPSSGSWVIDVAFDSGEVKPFMFPNVVAKTKFICFHDHVLQEQVELFAHGSQCSRCKKIRFDLTPVDEMFLCPDCNAAYLREEAKKAAKKAEEEYWDNYWDRLERLQRVNQPHALHKYIPTKYYSQASDEDIIISRRILDYKDGVKYAFEFFTDELQDSLIRIAEESDYNSFALVAVPTSTAGRIPTTAASISQIVDNIMAGRLSKKTFLDCSSALARIQTVPKAHLVPPEARLDASQHAQTIACTEEDLPRDSLYILIDDIITRGAHMRACRNVLMNSGIPEENFYYLSIGYTSTPGYEDYCEYV